MPVLPLVASRRPRSAAEKAAACGVGDDGGGGAVFDGAAGVGPFGLAEDLDSRQVRGQAFEADERRVADAFEDGGAKRFDGGDHAASIFIL